MGRANNRRVIGQMKPKKPFPVVCAVLRPVNKKDQECTAQNCEGKKQLGERPKAMFAIGNYASGLPVYNPAFTRKEQEELYWEKTYRDQLAGKEPTPDWYPKCSQCAQRLLSMFIGDTEKATLMMISAITTGQDLVLLDRNLSRQYTHPTIACGRFTTIADFRKQYFESLEQE